MVYLSKKETEKIIKTLSNLEDKESKSIIIKLKSKDKKKIYVTDKPKIRKLLRKAFHEKRKVKISYYSRYSDEVRGGIVSIYQLGSDFIIAFCRLRKEERSFVIDRISRAIILDEEYKIPKDWEPESRVW